MSMTAEIESLWTRWRRRVVYSCVTMALVSLLKAGHATKWNFHLGGASTARATEARPLTEPALVVRSASATADELPVDDAVALKAGIQTERAAKRAIRRSITVSGVVDYDQDRVAHLSVRTAGHVWRVERRAGEPIKKGDCLAIIDAVEVGEAKTEFLQAVVHADLKKMLLERLRTVVDEVAEKVVRQAEADERESRLRLHSAQQRLINLGLPVRMEEVVMGDDAELVRQVRLLGLPGSITEKFDPQTTTANLIPLTAPFDGIVIGRSMTVGEVVSPETSQFVVADVEKMWIVLDVRKEDAAAVRIGQEIDFTPDGGAGPVTGKIDWISTELDAETRTLQVRAVVDNPVEGDASGNGSGARILKARTFGIGRIVLADSPGAVAVPSSSVHFDGMRHFVFVRDGGLFRRREVKVGTANREFTEISSGLNAGERVASEGSHVLKAEWLSRAAKS
jgi:cobalt-zinc-cadmium efflux system membrane fusion protein